MSYGCNGSTCVEDRPVSRAVHDARYRPARPEFSRYGFSPIPMTKDAIVLGWWWWGGRSHDTLFGSEKGMPAAIESSVNQLAHTSFGYCAFSPRAVKIPRPSINHHTSLCLSLPHISPTKQEQHFDISKLHLKGYLKTPHPPI